MITSPIALCSLVACAALFAAAALAPFVMLQLTRLWRKATPLGRFVFVSALSVAALYGGSKINDVDDAGGSVTNQLTGLARRFLAPVFRVSTVTPEEVACGWQIVSVENSPNWLRAKSCFLTSLKSAALRPMLSWWLRALLSSLSVVSVSAVR